MFLFVIGMIVEACESPNPKAISLSRAEAMLDRDSAQAMALYANMPEIYFNEENFFCLHREECLVSMYLHKAEVELKKGNIKALEPIAQNIINWNNRILCRDVHTLITSRTDQNIKRGFVFLRDVHFLEKDSLDSNIKDSLMADISQNLADAIHDNIIVCHERDNIIEKVIIKSDYYNLLLILTIVSLLIVLLYQWASVKISSLKSAIFQQNNEVKQLNMQIEQLHTTSTQSLGIGKQIYDNVKKGGVMKNISIKDEQCFINYYAYIYPHEYNSLIKKYTSLTLRHTTYPILNQMMMTDKEIQRILFVSSSTIRNYRLRIKRNTISKG